jgi:6-pyruvoyltetrahydropterin/6-carboxytetrahydropterin synthase
MKITRGYRVEAAHFLTGVPPEHKCSRMHGHHYHIKVTVDGPIDPVTGMVIDYWDIDKVVWPVLERLDHQCINDAIDNPTGELIAVWLGGQISELPGLTQVEVFETPDCSAIWEAPSVAGRHPSRAA